MAEAKNLTFFEVVARSLASDFSVIKTLPFAIDLPRSIIKREKIGTPPKFDHHCPI
jgi:hypothetical protein